MINKYIFFSLFAFLTAFSSALYGQWTEHRTPVGKHISSLAFVGDQVFAQLKFPNSIAFETVTAQNGGPWANLVVPVDTLCPGGLCKSKTIESENGHLYYVNANGWPAFAYKSDDAGQTWSLVIPHYSEFSEVLFSGDHIFASVSNVVWRSDSDGLESYNSFSSQTNSPISDICQWDDKLLVLDGIGLWVSANSGDTWTPLTSAITTVGLSYQNADLFAFGNSLFLSAREQGMHTSTDGGATWNLLPFPGGEYVHSMIEYNGELFCGDGKSLFTSTNGGLTWEKELAAPGPSVLKVNGDELWMGTDYGVFKSTDGGKNWYTHNLGLHRPLVGSPYTPSVNKTLFSHAGRLFLSTEFGLFDTSDEGATWRYAGNFADVTGGIDGDSSLAIRENYQWGYNWYYSRDTAQTWQAFPMPPNTPATYNPLMYANGYYYAFVNSFCYRSNNFGQDWEQLPVDFGAPVRQAVFSQGKIFAVTGGNGYFISTDLGMTWTNPGVSSWPDLQLYAGTQQVYAHYGINYFRYDTDHWQNIPFWEPGNYTLVVGDQTLLAYRMDSPYAHKLLVSDNNGESWANIIGTQPYLTDLGFDLGAAAFGLHNNHFYAFGQSETDSGLPALWELEAGEPGDPIRTGKVFFDHNNDGIPGHLETGIPNIEVSTPSTQAMTDASGDFALFSGTAGDTLRPFLVNSGWTSNPTFHVITAAPKSYHFAITPAPGAPDLTVTATATAAFRPGFITSVKIRITNTGAVNATGVVRFVKPAILNVVSTSPTAALVSTDTIFWNLDLLPFGVSEYFVLLETPASVPLGDLLAFFAEAVPDIPDSAPADNAVNFTETVVGSFDPNDKRVNPVRVSTAATQNGAWLDYTIRFQNTGTFYASLVRITDTLSEQLDIRSVQILGASHPCTYTFREGRVLEAIFNDINLPDSLSDETRSHGFVRFAIRLLPGLMPADTVRNAANIFFDFNAPIRTDAAKTWIDATISSALDLPDATPQLVLFPNPATTTCTILPPAGIALKNSELVVVAPSGIILRRLPFAEKLDVSDLAPGVYFVVMKTEEGVIAAGRLIKMNFDK